MIITDENLLRKPSEPVSIEEGREIIKKLDEALVESEKNGQPGIGLSAPQIGIYKNVFIVRLNGTNIDLVNPIIEKKYSEYVFLNEGCLSFPDKYVNTKRFEEIVVKNDIEPRHFVAQKLLAVVIQHEYDHLRGVVLPDLSV